MPRSRYRIFEDEYPYFRTNTVVAWLPVFVRPAFADIILDSWRFLQRQRGVRIFGWVIMENHLHWIAQGEGMAEQVGRFKSFTARRIIDELARLGFDTLLHELRHFKVRYKIDQTHQFGRTAVTRSRSRATR
jgi:REP element-mobilizing transposase RayT